MGANLKRTILRENAKFFVLLFCCDYDYDERLANAEQKA
jgi:hypothetical protein